VIVSIIDNHLYGAYSESRPPTITQYGVATDKYGVITDPLTTSLLLLETGDLLLQEDGSNILL
jgi:hypothetical protein